MARKNQKLNTSVRATFKDGHTEDFNSIEEASEKTGITIASIKIRCNKKGCGGKDKTLFDWLDPHTKRSYQAKKSKNKGSAFEGEVIHVLREIGYPGCVSSRSESKFADANKIDIVDTDNKLPVNIQCKYTQNTPSYFNIAEACTDKSKPFCLTWKKSAEEGSISKGSVAIIPLDFFYDLLKLQYEHLFGTNC